ncbi:MAG: hypothetical protein HZA50_16930 [Planctomycetes bacterium]|nr:hypothetical protein [Planctomycetota bacterium]
MPNLLKPALLDELKKRYGALRKLEGSESLFEIGDRAARVYIRYSKIHARSEAFYGLRREDLKQLEGLPSVLCFLWDGQKEPLFVPFAEYEDVFHTLAPAKDGQYKAMVYPQTVGTELYFPKAGRFNVEGNFGYAVLDALIDSAKLKELLVLSHPQVQTLLGAVGSVKGYDVWIPTKDRSGLDWNITKKTFQCRENLPSVFDSVMPVLQEIDVVWVHRGGNELGALFEIEHSTPVYSGLLRLNDVLLVAPKCVSRYTVVSNDSRRSLFVRQLNRPTFRTSGLSEICTFLEYADVFGWHRRLSAVGQKEIP